MKIYRIYLSINGRRELMGEYTDMNKALVLRDAFARANPDCSAYMVREEAR